MTRDVNLIIPVKGPPAAPSKGRQETVKGSAPFEDAFQKELEKSKVIKFSAHAEKRLKERNIVLAKEDLVKIDRAVRQAESKGARDSLIIYGDLALVASILNRTVVTAMDGNLSGNHVFTNIDSAVIVK